MVSEKLLPCPNPWCDCPDELVVEPIIGTGAYGVECGCGFNGPALSTPELAIAAWNTRAPAELRSALEAELKEARSIIAQLHSALPGTFYTAPLHARARAFLDARAALAPTKEPAA